jgi:ketosteroid isomerase-like protein
MTSRARLLPLLILPVLACAPARPAPTPAAVAAADQRDVLEVERAWVVAGQNADTGVLDAILDDGYLFTFGSRTPIDKRAFIHAVAKGKTEPQTLIHERVQVDGDTAVVDGIDTLRVVVDGQPDRKAYRYTGIFVKKDGRWRALSANLTPMP